MDENEAQITVESQTMTDIDNRDPKEIHAEGARVRKIYFYCNISVVHDLWTEV